MAGDEQKPFQLTLSEQAQDDLRRWPELRPALDSIAERASPVLQQRLQSGDNVAFDVHGQTEQVTLRVGLVPPSVVRVEQVAAGDITPQDAVVV